MAIKARARVPGGQRVGWWESGWTRKWEAWALAAGGLRKGSGGVVGGNVC